MRHLRLLIAGMLARKVDHLVDHRINNLRIRLIRLDQVALTAESLRPAIAEHLALIAALARVIARAVAAMEANLLTRANVRSPMNEGNA